MVVTLTLRCASVVNGLLRLLQLLRDAGGGGG